MLFPCKILTVVESNYIQVLHLKIFWCMYFISVYDADFYFKLYFKLVDIVSDCDIKHGLFIEYNVYYNTLNHH